jgi:TonB family protein
MKGCAGAIFAICATACAHGRPEGGGPLREPPPPSAVFVQAFGTCAPAEPRLPIDDPPWKGIVLMDYVVREDGVVADVRAEILDGTPPALQAMATATEWMTTSCRFSPATLDGVPKSVELGQIIQFGPPRRAVPMLQAGMMRPAVKACADPHPRMPQEARDKMIAGTVVVQYVVDTDGSIDDIELKAPGPVAFFRAVREWLSGCRFDPATEAGHAIAVRVVQPFVFKVQ